MIREYKEDDFDKLTPNEWSKPENVDFLQDPNYYKYTLEGDGIMAIMLFQEQDNNSYGAFLLIGEEFTRWHVRELRKFLYDCIERFAAKSVWTVSRDCEIISRMHKFLGLKKDHPVVIENKNFNVWSISNGG